MQDRLNTPVKLKRWLDDNSVTYDADDNEDVLRTMVKRRMKRHARETTSLPAARQIIKDPISLHAFMSEMDAIRQSHDTKIMYRTVVARIDKMAPEVLKKKHHAQSVRDACRGFVYNGTCYTCSAVVEGVDVYSFTVSVVDVNNAARSINLPVSDPSRRCRIC